MDSNQRTRISKKLSYALRHRPEAIKITLDKQGWTSVSSVLEGFKNSSMEISIGQLEEVVSYNNKQRFEFNEDKTRIRARQGHSVKVDLGYKPNHPPQFLYHGTPARNKQTILANGLKKMNRHHVHMSPDLDTARTVARRHGSDWVLLKINASAMAKMEGVDFFLTDNHVWLTDAVPAAYIEIHSQKKKS